MSGDSYLSKVKGEMESMLDQLADDDEATLDTYKKRLWRLFEGKLKESYANGRESSGKHRFSDVSERGAADRPRNPLKR